MDATYLHVREMVDPLLKVHGRLYGEGLLVLEQRRATHPPSRHVSARQRRRRLGLWGFIANALGCTAVLLAGIARINRVSLTIVEHRAGTETAAVARE